MIKILSFVPVDLDKHKSILLDLNSEYLSWIAKNLREKYDLDLFSILGTSLEEYSEVSLEDLISYKPPQGIYYLFKVDEKVAGMGALRKIQINSGEIKRMFILPEFRGKGFGKVLLNKLLEKGKEFGCSIFILDTGKFMKSAQHLYRLAGFQESAEHPKSEVPMQLRHLWLFMEKKLKKK